MLLVDLLHNLREIDQLSGHRWEGTGDVVETDEWCWPTEMVDVVVGDGQHGVGAFVRDFGIGQEDDTVGK